MRRVGRLRMKAVEIIAALLPEWIVTEDDELRATPNGTYQ